MKSLIFILVSMFSYPLFASDLCIETALKKRDIRAAAHICKRVGSDACFKAALEKRGVRAAANICAWY